MVIAMVVGFGVSGGAVPYQVIDLGPGGSSLSGEARAINSSGQVVGSKFSSVYVGYHAFRWDSSYGPRDLLALPGYDYTWATGVSDDGRAVGESYGGGSYQGEACLWQSLTPQGLGFLPGDYDCSLAYHINNAGQVVGTSSVYSDQHHTTRPVLWENGVIRNLGVIDAFQAGSAAAINDTGMVVGACYTYEVAMRACLWSDGLVTYLGEPAGHTFSSASDINNLGAVVGGSGPSWWQSYACLWRHGVATNLQLDVPEGYQSWDSRATAINNLDQVVGYLINPANPRQGHAYLWENDSMQLLPGVADPQYGGWTEALGINDDGWIVGFAGDQWVTSRAVLWIPVPEPTGLLALASGLAGLGGAFFRRRRR
jgi:probable HAF family extracellular repeat protein